MTTSRDAILTRIRRANADALGAGGPGAPPFDSGMPGSGGGASAGPGGPGGVGADRLIPILVSRLTELGATAEPVDAGALRLRIEATIAAHHATRVLTTGLPAEIVDGLPGRVAGSGVDRAVVADVDAVISGCSLAVAETGSLVLLGGAGERRRMLTLLPDVHICVVDARSVVADLPEAMPWLRAEIRASCRSVTVITGPSATSDIELRRVAGVHGPRHLHVLITQGEAG